MTASQMPLHSTGAKGCILPCRITQPGLPGLMQTYHCTWLCMGEVKQRTKSGDNTVVNTISVGSSLNGVAVAPDGDYVYVASSETVWIIGF